MTPHAVGYGIQAALRQIERQRSVSHFEGKVVEVELPPGHELNCDGEFVDGGLDYVTATANAFRLVVA